MFHIYVKNKGAKLYSGNAFTISRLTTYSEVIKSIKVKPKSVKLTLSDISGNECIEFSYRNKTYTIVNYSDWS